jgi:hypothetical protein
MAMNKILKTGIASLLLLVIPGFSYPNMVRAEDITPRAPTNLFSVATTPFKEVILVWQDNSNNEDGFKIERSINVPHGFQEIAEVMANISAFIDDEIAPVTKYYYRVRSFNDAGFSAYSNIVMVETPRAPAAPSNLVAGLLSGTPPLVALLWQDNSQGEEGFKIERSTIGSTEGFSTIKTVGPNITFLVDTLLSPNTTYWYRVAAFGSLGASLYSNVAQITTPPSGDPAVVTIESASSEVPAQNIAINVPDQPLGGFKVTVEKEPITVGQTVFNLSKMGWLRVKFLYSRYYESATHGSEWKSSRRTSGHKPDLRYSSLY